VDKVYSEQEDDRFRLTAYDVLESLVKTMQDEAAFYGKPFQVGAYHPLLPYANDARARAAAERDARGYLSRLDFAAPELYLQATGPAKWMKAATDTLDACERLMPGKPVYPVMTPLYMDRTPEKVRHTPMPEAWWRMMLERLLRDPRVAGIIFWGGVKFSDNPDGSKRLPFKDAEPYIAAALEVRRRLSPE
jgi:hypothetical protein